MDHLTDPAPSKEDAQYKRWIVEAEILYTWILDSMTTELANCFIEYATVKEIWDAAQTYHSKKNDKAKIAQLVIRAGALQQGEKTVLVYANELIVIYSELDNYQPPVHNSVKREYTLMDRVYRLLQGLRPEFENIRSLLCNRENPISFDDDDSQLIGEESRLQEIKRNGESSTYAVTTPGGTSSCQHGQINPNTKKPQAMGKNNLWCDYCKRKGQTTETCWKLQGNCHKYTW